MMEINFKSIFNTAWNNAKHAKNIFGGKASEYFAISLKLSWASFKATQARDTEETRKDAAERIASKKSFASKMDNRDVKNLKVMVDAIEDDVRVAYGKYIDVYFKDVQGNTYDWHTLESNYTVSKLAEGKEVTISFNFKNQHSLFGEKHINYVTANVLNPSA
jgi:hypothetical protein